MKLLAVLMSTGTVPQTLDSLVEQWLSPKESWRFGLCPSRIDLPRSEQEEELLLPKKKIQLKENNASHLQFLGCDSENWPAIIGYSEVEVPPGNLIGRIARDT